jgi:ferrous iron transport protein A
MPARHMATMADTAPEVPLAALAAGEQGAVIELFGGGGFVGRMAALGFTPGSLVRMVRNSGHGPLIVEVVDTQVALGRGEARHVIVRRSQP